jgi:mannosyltransferase
MRQWLPCGLFLTALLIRLLTISSEALWYDEAFTGIVARLSLPQMITATANDVHPPLFYIVEWVIVRVIGESVFGLRIASAVFSSLAAVELWRLVKQVSTERAAWIGAGLFMIAPGQLYYAQEARMYAMLTLLVLVAARAAHNRNWLRFGLACGLALYTHNLGALYVAPLSLYGLWQGRGRAFRASALAGVAYLPWAGILYSQLQNIAGGFWMPESKGIGGALYYLYYGTFSNRAPGWMQGHLIGLALILTLLSVYVLRGKYKQLAPILILAFLPAFLLSAVTELWRPMLLPRTLVPAGAGVLGMWGIALDQMKLPTRRAALALLIPMLIGAVGSYYLNSNLYRYDTDHQASIIRDGWQSGDAIYHPSLATYVTYGYYLPDLPSFLFPQHSDLSVSLTEETTAAMMISEQTPEQLAGRGYKRLWIPVAKAYSVYDPQVPAMMTMIEDYTVLDEQITEQRSFVTFTLYLIDLESDHAVAR